MCHGASKRRAAAAVLIVNFIFLIRRFLDRSLALLRSPQTVWLDRYRHRIVDRRSQSFDSLDPDWLFPRRLIWKFILLPIWYFQASEFIDFIVDGLVWFGLGVSWIISSRRAFAEYLGESDTGKPTMGFG